MKKVTQTKIGFTKIYKSKIFKRNQKLNYKKKISISCNVLQLLVILGSGFSHKSIGLFCHVSSLKQRTDFDVINAKIKIKTCMMHDIISFCRT